MIQEGKTFFNYLGFEPSDFSNKKGLVIGKNQRGNSGLLEWADLN